MPKEKQVTEQYKTTKSPNRFLKTAAAVLVVALILTAGMTVTAKALNFDVWGNLASWGKEFFHFTDISGANGYVPDKDFSIEYNQLRNVLTEHRIDEHMVPSWLPAGYVHKDVMVMESPVETSIYAIYERSNTELIIRIRQAINGKADQVEKSDNLLEIYVVDGVEYYIFSNNSKLQATWIVGEFECFIIGSITIDEMKVMIDSI